MESYASRGLYMDFVQDHGFTERFRAEWATRGCWMGGGRWRFRPFVWIGDRWWKGNFLEVLRLGASERDNRGDMIPSLGPLAHSFPC